MIIHKIKCFCLGSLVSRDVRPGRTVVVHLSQNPKIQGLTPTTGTGRERMANIITNTFWGQSYLSFCINWTTGMF